MALAALFLFVGLASVSRIAMSFIPNVMPVTIMAVMIGSKFGVQRGISFAILVTLASNAVLGHGWWSLFQIIGWASVAAVASVVKVHDVEGKLLLNRLAFASLWSVPIFSIVVSISILDSGMSMIEVRSLHRQRIALRCSSFPRQCLLCHVVWAMV